MTHHLLIQFVTWFVLCYFILLNGGYLVLNMLSLRTLHRKGQEEMFDDLPRAYSGLEPPVSILVPAYNEEATIAASVRSMLQLTYSEYEVLVVNDGSKDGTLEVLKREFGLLPFPEAYRRQIRTKDIRQVYRSTRFPNLRVIDKDNGGKADSLNAGINASRYPLVCGVDAEDMAEMVAELRRLDPKPGASFDAPPAPTLVPDVLMRRAPKEGWIVELNPETLPRVLVNRGFHARATVGAKSREEKAWVAERFQTASWLVKSLEQRATTILKVSSEIVRRQDGFFRHGVEHLRPLTLRVIAETIGMHESTVSRVTSNKYLSCDRGVFELKYFFTSGVATADGEGAASAEAVKAAIKALIEAEDAKDILSDDTLVDLLKEKGFDLARRTVAKYREAMGIGSSVQRRRQKKLTGVG